MLGRSGLKKESPNVIDPGEMAVSCPSRSLSGESVSSDGSGSNSKPGRRQPPRALSGASTSYSDTPQRERQFRSNLEDDLRERGDGNYKPSLSKSRVVHMMEPSPDQRYTGGASFQVGGGGGGRRGENDDLHLYDADAADEEDGTTMNTRRLPTAADARSFAAAMLSETERRRSRRNLYADLGIKDKGENVTLVGVDDPRREQRRKQVLTRAATTFVGILLAIIFAIFAALAVTRVRGMQDSTDYQAAADKRLEQGIALLGAGVSKENALRDLTTPQHQALDFLVNHDHMQLKIPGDVKSDEGQAFVQRYVLAVLFYALNGANWKQSLNFMTQEHECAWTSSIVNEEGAAAGGSVDNMMGITCNSDLQVQALVLSHNNAHGVLPDEIRQLKSLEVLNLQSNSIYGTMPHGLSRLTRLAYLNLNHNQVSGAVPDSMSSLTALEILGVSHNSLTGSFPESMGQTLTKLKTLSIGDNLLTGDIKTLEPLTDLEYLYAQDNNMKGRIDLGFLVKLSKLVELDISGNEIKSSEIPRELFAMSHLKVADLSDNIISGMIPEDISSNKALRFLSLRSNRVSGSIPDALANLSKLSHLDLEDNIMSGELTDTLGALTGLNFLFLGKNRWEEGSIPDSIQYLSRLRELSMDSSNLVGQIPSWLPNLVDLKLVDLQYNELTGSLPDGLSNLQDLSFLLLSENNLTGGIPEELGELDDLDVLSLHKNNFIGDASAVCQSDSHIGLLTTDCGAITCPCCKECCDTDGCYSTLVWDALEHNQASWELKFERTDYSFSYNMLSSQSDNRQDGRSRV